MTVKKANKAFNWSKRAAPVKLESEQPHKAVHTVLKSGEQHK